MGRYVRLSVFEWSDAARAYRLVPTDIAVDRIATMREKPVMPGPGMSYEDGGEIEVVGLGKLDVLETPARIKAAIARAE